MGNVIFAAIDLTMLVLAVAYIVKSIRDKKYWWTVAFFGMAVINGFNLLGELFA